MTSCSLFEGRIVDYVAFDNFLVKNRRNSADRQNTRMVVTITNVV